MENGGVQIHRSGKYLPIYAGHKVSHGKTKN